MENSLPVLIVGAGPTGLMMACELIRHGIPLRIIDKKSEPTTSSNATWIQTLTVELFDHIGIANKFIDKSNLCEAINIYIEGKSIGTISLTEVDSIYKYILMLPQSETEKLLTEYLEKKGTKIERGIELVDIKQNNKNVKATLKNIHDEIESVTSSYVIACDGANSKVREICKINFPGKDLTEQFVVADATIDSYMAKNQVHVFFSPNEIFSAFPLGDDRYRISTNLNLPVKRKFFYGKEIIEMAQERAYGTYYIKDVSWISLFWIHSKMIKKMRDNLIFFAGDAAHLHSPAGGQGMNLGIQDAYNLAWKLALVIKAKAKPILLNSYHIERYPITSKIVKKTSQYTQMAVSKNNFLKKLKLFMTNLNRSKKKLAKEIALEITQLNTKYSKSPIIKYNTIKSIIFKPGDHVPNVIINEKEKLYDYLHNTKHNLFLMAGTQISKKKLESLVNLKALLDQKYSAILKTTIISTKELDLPEYIFDKNTSIHKFFNVKKPFLCILRPDNYICYLSTNFDLRSIVTFFNKFLY